MSLETLFIVGRIAGIIMAVIAFVIVVRIFGTVFGPDKGSRRTRLKQKKK